MRYLLFISFLLFINPFMTGQVDGQQPASYRLDVSETIEIVEIQAQTIPLQISSSEPMPLLAGFTIPFTETILHQGKWGEVNSKLFVWRLALHVEEAKGLNLYIENFNLNSEEKLFIYKKDKSVVLGPFTELDKGSYFVSDFISGDEIIIEFNTNNSEQELPFQLSELGVSTNGQIGRDFGDSQFCEIPVNCAEGDDWQNEKGGIARVLVKEGSDLWWCTGSLVNNTKNDKTPYFLTANHCGQSAGEADYEAWKFYFDYESTDCEIPVLEPEGIKLTGSKLLAKAPNSTSTASDFKLLLLTDEIPDYFHPWYNGWDKSGDVSPSGVCIHHPEGDLKMISTYDEPIVSTRYNVPSPDEDGIYWKVNWAETQNGHGVTEPGSSGSPLFNSSGNIVGGLLGGHASCDFPEKPDYYGKFSYSWESNGNDSSSQLKYWLDPDNTGVSSINGSNFNPSDFYADFSTDNSNIKLGESVQFTNWSDGNINKYEWVFSNGEPSSFTGENPPPIRYTNAGSFDVSLKVSNVDNSDVKLRKAYIQVKPLIFPNPTNGKLTISFGKEGTDLESLQLFAYDITGRAVNFFAQTSDDESAIIIDLSKQSRGMYFLRLIEDGEVQLIKVIVSK